MIKLSFSALLLLCITCIYGQPEYNHNITTVDTASSIFSMNRCVVVPTKKIPFSDGNGHYPYRVNMNYDSTFLTVKFPGTSWLKLAFYKEQRGSFAIHTDYLTGGGLYSIEYINLLPLYGEIPGLFDSVQGGVTVQIRFQSYISIDEGAWFKIYSNVESLYLPPATGDDINFFNYLKENLDGSDDIRDFAALDHIRFKGDRWGWESWEFLMNQYPNSILCDHAKEVYLSFKYGHRRELEGSSPELDLWRKNQLIGLRHTTKSDILYDSLKRRYYPD